MVSYSEEKKSVSNYMPGKVNIYPLMVGYLSSFFPIPIYFASCIENKVRSFLWSWEENGKNLYDFKYAYVIPPKKPIWFGNWLYLK